MVKVGMVGIMAIIMIIVIAIAAMVAPTGGMVPTTGPRMKRAAILPGR